MVAIAQSIALTEQKKRNISLELDALSMVFKLKSKDFLNLSEYHYYKTPACFETDFDMKLTDDLWLEAMAFVESSLAFLSEKTGVAQGGI
jgi:hypothetical protein